MKRLLACLLGLFALLAPLPAAAEDIDVFASPPGSVTYLPNVLVVLDNSASFVQQKAALKAVLEGMPVGRMRIGLMLLSESGGYLRGAVRPLDAANRTRIASVVDGLDAAADRVSTRELSQAMAEAYRYFAGAAAANGPSQRDVDAVAATGNYASPVQDACQRNFVIYIGGSGGGRDSSAGLAQARMQLAESGGDITPLPAAPDNHADEWARFMKNSPLGITTYAIDVAGSERETTVLLRSMASQGGGRYFEADGTQLQRELARAMGLALADIQAVHSAFAPVTLPLGGNAQGSYLNQVYVGMFQPDAGAAPRWSGNLKQYKLGLGGGNLRLLDANGNVAVNGQTGFIAECARSFWTPAALDSYWSFKGWPAGAAFCPPSAGASAAQFRNSNSPDGGIVEKGAQAHQLRGGTARSLYTCAGSTMAGCSERGHRVPFTGANVTPAALGAGSGAERDALVSWARGLDLQDEDLDGATANQMRASVHGDVVHSRPVALNFQDGATSRVVVFYGGNDGMLRAVNGSRGDAAGGQVGAYGPGQELWSFMPPEALGNLKRLRDNSTLVALASEAYGPDAATAAKPYGVDGPITAFRGNVDGAGKTFIYASMRRGGRSIYAFDVTDTLTTPAEPVLKWRIGCAGASDCSTGMANLGQTWSAPKAFTTVGVGGGATPLLVFGGGYDACEDADAGTAGGANHACGASSKGASIYVVNADTGALVKEFATGLNRGVVADVTLVRDSSGQVILGYSADLGGNVYRIKFGSATPAGWQMERIAALGCSTTAGCPANRKFMFAPSVVTTDAISMDATYHLMLGSGDREKPIAFYSASNAVANHFFQFTDKPGDAGYPGTTDCGANLVCMASLQPITSNAAPTAAMLAAKKGWSLALAPTEQVVTSAVTVFGVVSFSSHKPATTSAGCSRNLGEARVYNIGYTNAAPAYGDTRAELIAGGGLPPSPVAGQVTLDDGVTVPFCIGCSKDSPLEARLPASLGSTSKPKGRLYWYVDK